MNINDANKIVTETFQQEFDDSRYLRFIKELLNGAPLNYGFADYISPSKVYTEFIDKYKVFGIYESPDKKRIIFAAVRLHRDRSRDGARVMQRNFGADLLRGKVTGRISGAQGALIAFYGEDKDDWRLSFVTMETELVCNEKGVCVSEILSPAKRSSFLVGKYEPCHTCMKRFSPLIVDEESKLTFKTLSEVFHVETVTKAFFEEYTKCFYKLEDSLKKVIDNDPIIQAEFKKQNLEIPGFCKKLLGQIVFLYFLQKKGWLGVKRGEAWGSGPKDFMRQLFDGKIVPYENFFNDVLEHLFYDALNKKNDSDYYVPFKVRIPFLNGGLFENEYDWVNTDIVIDNAVFKEIFETFDLYNFTVKEDEPLEKEVAVDPEMLGKVFESLLETTDRKAKGAFYTPRYVVHYICQESLIEYLSKHIDIPKEDIELFIQKGDEMYAITLKNWIEAKFGGKQIEGGLPESIKSNALKIDTLLKEIKIADPAVGSGAFPVGMMNEIVKARTALTPVFGWKPERNSYNLKRETIEHSIYGVDLDPSAVDISKLRFWLSLIVDEENPKEIKPLPNLDHKIMAGNSLLETFKGVKLFDDEILSTEFDSLSDMIAEIDEQISTKVLELDSIAWGTEQERSKLLSDEIEMLKKKRAKILSDPKNAYTETLSTSKTAHFRRNRKGLKQLKICQAAYFNEQDRFKKKELKQEMERLEWELLENAADGDSKTIAELKTLRGKKGKPFFLWKLYFSDVFTRENPGFDCVIGNPPYVQLQVMDEEIKKAYVDSGFSTYAATGDIYCLFYEKGWNLLREQGTLGYITSNKWMRAGYGQKLRKFFAEKTDPFILIDFAGQKIFEEATVDVNILLYRKSSNNGQTLACTVKADCSNNLSDYVKQNGSTSSYDSDESWTILSSIEQSIHQKIQQYGVPLKKWDIQINFGIKTGYNEAFIISSEKRSELIAQDSKSAEIIRPILRGRDIKRYSYENKDLWLIALFPSKHYDIENYPAVKNYLLSFGLKKLEQTGKEYIRSCN